MEGEEKSGRTCSTYHRFCESGIDFNPGGAGLSCFRPPAIPGIGTSGGVTFMLEDRSGQDVPFLAEQNENFHPRGFEAARDCQDHNHLYTCSTASVSARRRDKVLKQGVELSNVYKTLQTFMGGCCSIFNRFGRSGRSMYRPKERIELMLKNLGQFS